jgi:hypothetical protein
MTRLASTLLLLSLSLGCKGGATASFPIGVEVSVSADELALPDTLRDGDVIASVPCGPMGMCPGTAEAPVTCEADLCDPAPRTISLLVGEVDVDELAGDVGEIFDSIDTIDIDDVTYRIERNSLTVATTELEIFWGPATAVALDESMGVRRLGTMPALAAGATGEGAVVLDAAGSAAFSRYFEDVSHRFRFFVRTTVDLEPGQPWPAGELEAAVRMAITLEGSLL